MGVTVHVCNSADFHLVSGFHLCKLSNKFRAKTQIDNIDVSIVDKIMEMQSLEYLSIVIFSAIRALFMGTFWFFKS